MKRSRKSHAVWVSPLCLALSLGGLTLAGPMRPARAQSPSFEASAAVTVQVQEDLVRARSQALSDALGRALEQAVAQVAPESRSRVYLVQSRARDYVTTYRVLEEGEQAGQFQIRVEVQFDLPRLLRDLQAAPGRPAPTQSVMTVCSAAGAAEVQAAVAATRAQLAERLGTVETLDAAACGERVRSQPAGPLLVLVPDPTPHSEEIRGTQPVRFGAVAHAEWQLYRSGGEPTLKEQGEGIAFLDSAGAALIEAQRQAAQAALTRLTARPGALPHGAAGVLMTLEGVGSFGNYQQLLKALGSLPGVSRVEPRRFVGAAGGAGEESKAQVLIQTAATAETLGAALGRAPLGGMRLQVAPIGPTELRVIVASPGALPSPTEEGQPEAAEPERAP